MGDVVGVAFGERTAEVGDELVVGLVLGFLGFTNVGLATGNDVAKSLVVVGDLRELDGAAEADAIARRNFIS